MTADRDRNLLANVNVRLAVEQAEWLSDLATARKSSISAEVRSLIWQAMERAGSIEVVDRVVDEDEHAELLDEHERLIADDLEHER